MYLILRELSRENFPANPIEKPGYVLTFSDEFDGSDMDAAIQAYRAEGKDDNWIRARMEGKIKRNLFTAALTRTHYATATDDVYRGLWNRTAAHLKSELELSKNDRLRDHQPMLALYYQGIAEELT